MSWQRRLPPNPSAPRRVKSWSKTTLRFQVIVLRVLGAILWFPNLLLSRGSNFHMVGYGLLSQWIGNTFFNHSNMFTLPLIKPGKSFFTFYLNDRYWNPLVLSWSVYECEVAEVLNLVLKSGTAFLDCGANIGYWSVYSRSLLQNPDAVVAVEPYPTSFELLMKNAQLNGGFICLNDAIAARDGLQVLVVGNHHSTMSIDEQGLTSGNQGIRCQTTTLDTIYQKYVKKDINRIVIKLDIEGTEIQALKGADNILEGNPLIIYEDHGKDKTSKISHYLKKELGYRLYYWQRSGGLSEVSLAEISAIKGNRRIGYNFFAYTSDEETWW